MNKKYSLIKTSRTKFATSRIKVKRGSLVDIIEELYRNINLILERGWYSDPITYTIEEYEYDIGNINTQNTHTITFGNIHYSYVVDDVYTDLRIMRDYYNNVL